MYLYQYLNKMQRLLKIDQKQVRTTISQQYLGMFKRVTKDFVHRFVTVDETWINRYNQEIKFQSKEWTSCG